MSDAIDQEIARKKRALVSEARNQAIREITRARRLCTGLNAAIRGGNADRIRHWQQLGLPFYGIPHGDWYVSQIPDRKEIEYAKRKAKAEDIR